VAVETVLVDVSVIFIRKSGTFCDKEILTPKKFQPATVTFSSYNPLYNVLPKTNNVGVTSPGVGKGRGWNEGCT